MDIFKRELAPVTDTAWDEIREEAQRRLRANLTARRVMDLNGPHGPDFAALSLGRLQQPAEQPVAGVGYGVHRVLPLVELRAPFELDKWELDNAERGAQDLDLDPVADAARAVAHFEERAIYEGLETAGIPGLRAVAEHKPIKLGADPVEYAKPIAQAVDVLRGADVTGEMALVLGPKTYNALAAAHKQGYQPWNHVEKLIGGPILSSPVLAGGFLLSQRGGDFEIILGQDAALGWERSQEAGKVRLFLMESFSFRVIDPEAFVVLDA